MSDILSQLLTLPVRIGLGLTVIILIMLYLLAIVWVNRDARQRDTAPMLWTIVAIIPVAGLVAYCLLRPPLTTQDAREQEMEIQLLHHQLQEYGKCQHCGYPTKSDYVICPHCRRQLRNVCTRCGHALEPDWAACPYCTTPVHGGASKQPRKKDNRAAEVRARTNRPAEAEGDPFAPTSADIAE